MTSHHQYRSVWFRGELEGPNASQTGWTHHDSKCIRGGSLGVFCFVERSRDVDPSPPPHGQTPQHWTIRWHVRYCAWRIKKCDPLSLNQADPHCVCMPHHFDHHNRWTTIIICSISEVVVARIPNGLFQKVGLYVERVAGNQMEQQVHGSHYNTPTIIRRRWRISGPRFSLGPSFFHARLYCLFGVHHSFGCAHVRAV